MINISVIIPVYNVEKYISECLDSVVHQTIKDFEIICVDDGSPDNSVEVIKEYQRKYCNIILIQQKNQGSGPARNNGLKNAKGEYVCFMDPDDLYANDFVLEKLYNAAKDNEADICGGNIIYFKELGKWYLPKSMEKFHINKNAFVKLQEYQNAWGHQRYIFKKNFLMSNNIEYPAYIRGQDPPFMLNALINAKQIYMVSDNVYLYRQFDVEKQYNDIQYKEAIVAFIETMYMAMNNGLHELSRCLLARIHSYFVGLNNLNKCDDFLYRKKCELKYYLDDYNNRYGQNLRIEKNYKELGDEIEFRGISCAVWGYGKLGKEIIDNWQNDNHFILEIYDKDNKKYGISESGLVVKGFSDRSEKVELILVTNTNLVDEIAEEVHRNSMLKVFDVQKYISWGYKFEECIG